MKANALMVGDWVHVEAHRGFNAQNVKVETIPDNDGDNKYGHHYGHIGTWLDGGDNDFRDVEAKHLQPIPLTPEILEKNGFTKSTPPSGIHAKCYELDNKKDKYNLTIADYNKYKRLLLNVDSEDSECFNIKCDYVHELQHALRLCRIEKEIEL